MKIRRPDDMHVHFRGGVKISNIAPHTCRQFARALVMPNVPAITTPARMVQYREEILAASRNYNNFEPLMTMKLHAGLTPRDIVTATHLGMVAGKIYPEGVTTGSEDGLTIQQIREMGDVFSTMQELGVVLCWHGQMPGEDVYCLDREPLMLPEIRRVVDDFPRLKQVVEHISTRRAVDWVWRCPDTVAATITVHHLMLTLDDVLGGGRIGKAGKLYPHHYCAPIAQDPGSRDALIYAATSGSPKFFLGTDSAPHPKEDKEASCGCAGIFSAPVAMQALAMVFERVDKLGALEDFTSRFGAEFYRLPLNEDYLELERESWVVPDSYCNGVYVPFLAGMALPWRLVL